MSQTPSSPAKRRLVYCIAIAEFDILKGNTLSVVHPPEHAGIQETYKERYLADLCLPDGAHEYEEDITHIFVPYPTDDSERNNGPIESAGDILYGMALFRNKRDPSVKRGAIQKALVLFCTKPFFSVFEPLMRIALLRILDKGEDSSSVLKILYDNLADENLQRDLSVTLFNEKIPIKMPKLEEDQFAGVSLIDLVTRFKADSMLLWHGLLNSKRIMFVGTPAKLVGNCCLVLPMLVSPLRGFSKLISPYVALNDLEPVLRPVHISGTTNILFQTKPEWWDFCGSFSTGTVIQSTVKDKQTLKISASEKVHILNVLGGIQDGKNESWVREQFVNFTRKFLETVANEKKKKNILSFKQTEYYQNYLQQQTELKSKGQVQKSAVELLDELSNDNSKMAVLDRNKKIFELYKRMDDLTAIDDVCEHNGVQKASQWLADDNSQFRKYAASVMAQLASSVKGQLAILNSGDVLEQKLVNLLGDEMPNVRIAGAYCIMKISTLFIGVRALLKLGMVEQLCEMRNDTINDIKTYAVQTLYNIFRYAPSTTIPNAQPFLDDLKKTADDKYTTILLQLMDLWGCSLKGLIKISPRVKQLVTALVSSEDTKAKITMLNSLTAEYESSPWIILQTVEAGVVPTLVACACEKKNRKLSQLAIQLLTKVADFYYGACAIMKTTALEQLVKKMASGAPGVTTLHLVRFFEVLCQFPDVCHRFVGVDGFKSCVNLLKANYYHPMMSNLCLMTIRCLFNVLRTLKSTNEIGTAAIQFVLDELENIPQMNQQQNKDASNERLQSFAKPLRDMVKQQLDLGLYRCLEIVGRRPKSEVTVTTPLKAIEDPFPSEEH